MSKQKYMEVVMFKPGDKLLSKFVVKANTIEHAVDIAQACQPLKKWNIGHVITHNFITKQEAEKQIKTLNHEQRRKLISQRNTQYVG